MATFNFPYHTVSTDYPESSFRVQLGNSYQYSAAPTAPDQRKFTLKFPLMKWYADPYNREFHIISPSNPSELTKLTNPRLNLLLLEEFYRTHKLHLTFTYPHPVYGALSVRFNKPLRIPEGLPGGDGAVANIELEFIEMPGVFVSGYADLTDVTYGPFLPTTPG